MADRLERFAALLAEVDSAELEAMRRAAEEAPQLVPGLLAWLEHAIGWELDRRAGRVYRLAWPVEAIPPEEEAASIATAMAMAEAFRPSETRDTSAIADLLIQVVDLLPLPSDARH